MMLEGFYCIETRCLKLYAISKAEAAWSNQEYQRLALGIKFCVYEGNEKYNFL
jgi:hypothetical protein